MRNHPCTREAREICRHRERDDDASHSRRSFPNRIAARCRLANGTYVGRLQGVSWSVSVDMLRTGEAVDFWVASSNRMTAVARHDEVALHVLFPF